MAKSETKSAEYYPRAAIWFEAAQRAPDELKNAMIDIGFGWQTLADEIEAQATAKTLADASQPQAADAS